MKDIINARNASGYSPFLPDFDYLYNGYDDACKNHCYNLRGNHYSGIYINIEFPNNTQNPHDSAEFASNMHENCRCCLNASNKTEAVTRLVKQELEDA
jgi:uncharacterized protein YpiB (UPF0302 family)